jgi:hypothetical protein
MIKIAVSLIFILTLNVGCATIFNNRRETVYVDSDPRGAEIQSNKLERSAKTPTSFSFWKGGEIHVDLYKEGYQDQTVEVNKELAPSFWLNLLALDLAPIGMVVDLLSGAMWNYEDTVFAYLEPTGENLPSQPEQQPQRPLRYSQPTISRPKNSFYGPRLGFAYLDDELIRTIHKEHNGNEHVGHIITQFGWNFEKRFTPNEDGVTFVWEAIPLIGAIDRDLPLYSIMGIMGIRTAGGIELGVGPRLYSNNDGKDIDFGAVYKGGMTFQYGRISIPLNMVVAPSQDGTSISVLTGFNR